MRKWAVIEPNWQLPEGEAFKSENAIKTIWTDYEIIVINWVWWSREVFNKRPDNTFRITPDNCINDWVAVNWAVEV